MSYNPFCCIQGSLYLPSQSNSLVPQKTINTFSLSSLMSYSSSQRIIEIPEAGMKQLLCFLTIANSSISSPRYLTKHNLIKQTTWNCSRSDSLLVKAKLTSFIRPVTTSIVQVFLYIVCFQDKGDKDFQPLTWPTSLWTLSSNTGQSFILKTLPGVIATLTMLSLS